jgi:hypothetical protein
MSDAATVAAYERQAEAAYAAMYDAQPYAVKDYHDDAQANFAYAISAAQSAGLTGEAQRLSARAEQVQAVYDSQFRGVGR